MVKITIDNIEYVWNPDDSYVKDDKEYRFARLEKIRKYKNRRAFQIVTVKPEHLEQFYAFLRQILEEVDF